MDPFLAAMMQQMQGTQTLQPQFQGAQPAGQGGDLASITGSLGDLFSGVQAPQAQKPQFSGGVSGAGMPFKTQITDLLTPALQNIQGQAPQPLPSLGAILAQAAGR